MTNNELKCWPRFICSLLQRRPEPRGEPSGTPEEDRQCRPAAQSLSDAGAGGGVKSTCSTTCATDLCAFHIPLLVVSGFIHFDGAHFKPKQKENQLLFEGKESSATLCIFLHFNRHYNQKAWKKRIGLPACQSLTLMTEERCTMGAAVQVKVRIGSFWGGGCFSLDFTLLLSLLTHLQSYLSPSLPLLSLHQTFQFPHPHWVQKNVFC